MQTVHTIRDLRSALLPWREKGETVGFIPTMGALHKGHVSLVTAAKNVTARTLASIFVNPMQLGANEDLGKYPRAIENDFEMLEAAGCDLLYAPSAKEVYPEGFVANIDPGPLATILEG
jgi:pantoate--beta-alanine ligase